MSRRVATLLAGHHPERLAPTQSERKYNPTIATIGLTFCDGCGTPDDRIYFSEAGGIFRLH